MQFNRREVRNPDQRGQIVGEDEIDGATVAIAPDGSGLYPIGPMHGRILFEEIFLIVAYTSGIALHSEWPSGEVRHQRGRDADVEIHYLPFGKTGGGIENLV